MSALETNRVWVYCGNGGDFEFEQDRAYWAIWIENNMPNERFVILPHDEADKAWVIFEAGRNISLFALKAPYYIEYKHVKEYIL